MRALLTSRLTLAAAWAAVVVGLAMGLTLAFLQPPPPARSEPVTIALLPAEPSQAVPQAAGESESPPPGATVELPQPAAAPAEQAPETPAAAVAQPEAAPPPATPEPAGPETGAKADPETAGDAAAAPSPEPAGEAAAQATAEAEAPAAEPEAPAPEAAEAPAPAAVAALPPPPAKPEAPAAADGQGQEGGAAPAEGARTEDPAAPGEQQVAIPAVPPALEQLPTWERYRQPFNMEDKRPRIAVVLTGLGLSDSATEAAINQLPPAVTLSFSPYARDLERWIALARSRGHEVMLDLPMEPASFPNEDPGPQGLLVGLSAEENLNRLDWVLSRGSAYVGLAGAMGSRFTASRDSVEPVLREVKDRGLIFLDRRTTEHSLVPALADQLGLPSAVNNRSVDERQASRVAIDARLAQIERIALTEGFAVAMAQPYPVTLDRLAEWSSEITSRGFALAPISALADLQPAP